MYPDPSIILVLSILVLAVILFITEKIRTDAIALIILLIISLLGLVTPEQAFSGFASEAVVATISIMILSYGIQRTGLMVRISREIMKIAGTNEKKIVATVSGFEGLISAFMQNVGAAALFLPALMRISGVTGFHSKRILLPIGYAAIIGGTVTMIGSTTLIMINDYLINNGYPPYDLFDVTPVGLMLVAAGIVYFYVFGDFVLPNASDEDLLRQRSLIENWHLPSSVYYLRVVGTSGILNKTREEVALMRDFNLHLLAIRESGDILYAPWKKTRFVQGQILAVLGRKDDVVKFSESYGLPFAKDPALEDLMSNDTVGFAELIIRPKSSLVGKSIQEVDFRKKYNLEPLILFSGSEGENVEFSERPLKAGDTIVVHGRWMRIRSVSQDPDFVVTTHIEGETYRDTKVKTAVACFLGSIILTFTGLSIALSFLTGALAMVLSGVISFDEAYRSVEWRVIILIGGLIPLEYAMAGSGAAKFIADNVMMETGGSIILLLISIAIIMTVFSNSMSNIAATAVFVPVIIATAELIGSDPRPYALLAGICASNSFILPTHQVNALIKSPGRYRNRDYIKAGIGITIFFLLISVSMIYFFYI